MREPHDRQIGCARCRLPYPSEFLNPVSGGAQTGYLCGICALEIVNEIHGTRLQSFQGEMAEQSRLDALDWREKHPRAQPIGKR